MHGGWSQDGKAKEETSDGQRQLASNSWSSISHKLPLPEPTPRSMATTWELLKGGGQAEVGIDRLTSSSGASTAHCSSTMAWYIQDMSPVRRTQPTLHPEAFTQTQVSSYLTSPSQLKPLCMSSISTTPSSSLGTLMDTVFPTTWERKGRGQDEYSTTRPLSSSNVIGKPRNVALPLTIPSAKRRPGPYPKNLTPRPSLLRPLCLARDRIHKWLPSPSVTNSHSNLPFADQRRIPEVMIYAWEENTWETYGSGLLIYHVFCDVNGTPESERAPAAQPLLSAFVASLAASYAGETISNYFYGVRAWHILHGITWRLEKAEMDTMLRAAEKLTPSTSKKKPRHPYTPNFIEALQHHLDLNVSLDVAVYACLTTCFYASARLGEFAVCKLDGFNSSKSVSRKHLSYNQDQNNHKVTVVHIPKTKASPLSGEDVFWARQNGATDPDAALENHL